MAQNQDTIEEVLAAWDRIHARELENSTRIKALESELAACRKAEEDLARERAANEALLKQMRIDNATGVVAKGAANVKAFASALGSFWDRKPPAPPSSPSSLAVAEEEKEAAAAAAAAESSPHSSSSSSAPPFVTMLSNLRKSTKVSVQSPRPSSSSPSALPVADLVVAAGSSSSSSSSSASTAAATAAAEEAPPSQFFAVGYVVDGYNHMQEAAAARVYEVYRPTDELLAIIPDNVLQSDFVRMQAAPPLQEEGEESEGWSKLIGNNVIGFVSLQ